MTVLHVSAFAGFPLYMSVVANMAEEQAEGNERIPPPFHP